MCACQGIGNNHGASYSFGCSRNHYFNTCKHVHKNKGAIEKFKLNEPTHVKDVEDTMQNMATDMAILFKKMAPIAYANQVAHESVAEECRLGLKPGKPFSGTTTVVDFCTHAHKDTHNMHGGTTVVVTLVNEANREFRTTVAPPEEQFHVLPHYRPAEGGDGSVIVLQQYEQVMAIKDTNKDTKESSKMICENDVRSKEQQKRVDIKVEDQKEKINMGDNKNAALPVIQTNPHHVQLRKRLREIDNLSVPERVAKVLKNIEIHNAKQVSSETTAFQKDCVDGVHYEATQNKEIFANRDMGGMAIALTHGSVLFECARQELHCTTPLKEPNRQNPTRIGVVFYQHKNLRFSSHGKRMWDNFVYKLCDRDYLAWMTGDFVPTEARVKIMKRAGMRFPSHMSYAKKGEPLLLDNVQPQDLSFLENDSYRMKWMTKLTLWKARIGEIPQRRAPATNKCKSEILQ